jgi:transglutaminase-like putative cysteine protease
MSSDQIRSFTSQHIINRAEQDGIALLTDGLSEEIGDAGIRPSDLKRLSLIADCIRLMHLTQKASIGSRVLEWVMSSEQRIRLLVQNIQKYDDVPAVFQNLEILTNDLESRDTYAKLILALSVVWDRPKRPPVHDQMGVKPLPYTADISNRYDYFKQLYASGESRLSYDRLSVRDLVFVVETPVPLSELRWAREHVKGSLEDWGQKFYSIEYDHGRIDRGEYDWLNGAYSLDQIRGRGGICVDQAYYAVITARAFGIPAIYFHALGSSGGHAWFSFMKAPGEWELDVGRYSVQGYTTGFAFDPQTNRKMTDHDVVYACERVRGADEFEKADEYISIAYVLRGEKEDARRCTETARQLAENYLPAWDLEMDILLASGDVQDAFWLFEEQRKAFKDYPDIVMASAARLEIAMRAAGQDDKVEELRRMMNRSVDDGRDDLERSLGLDAVMKIASSGDVRRARRKLEDLMEDHVKDGSKTFALIRRYLSLTQDTGQAKEAVRFLEEYIEQVRRHTHFSPGYEEQLLGFLARAYENNGDQKGREAVESRIKKL